MANTVYTPVVFCDDFDPTSGTITDIVVPVSVPTTEGDTLYLFIGHSGVTANNISSIVDTQHNVWTRVASIGGATNGQNEIWVTTSGYWLANTDVITITFSVATNPAIVGIDLPLAPVQDGSLVDFYSTSTSTFFYDTTATLANPYELVLASCMTPAAAASVTWSSSVPALATLATMEAVSSQFESVGYLITDATTGVKCQANFTDASYIAIGIIAFVLPGPSFPADTMPPGKMNLAYSNSVIATVYAGSGTFSITSGSLPPGLTMASTGVVSGTPTSNGTYSFTVEVVDGNGATASQVVSLTITTPVMGGGASGVLPTIPTFVAADSSLTKLQELSYAVSFLADCDTRPLYHAYSTGRTSITGSTWTTPAGGYPAYDNDNQGVSPNYMSATIVTQGVYSCELCYSIEQTSTAEDIYVSFLLTAGANNAHHSSGATQRFGIRSMKSGTTTTNDTALCSTSSTPWTCYPGDVIAAQVFTAANMTLDVNNNAGVFAGRFVCDFSTLLHPPGDVMIAELAALAVTTPASGGISTIDIIAWIGIPLTIAITGAIVGIVKGSIRFAQYMAHSEESSDSIAKSNDEISKTLNAFIARTDTHLGLHDQEIAVLKFQVSANGHGSRGRRHSEDE